MKKSISFIAALVFTVGIMAQSYSVDAKKSTVSWEGKKIGKTHNGTVGLKEGSFVIENDKIVSGTFIVDMTVITDESHPDHKEPGKLINHLKSDDFFSVDKYPEARLTVTGGEVFRNGEAKVKGQLTIKGKTHPIEFTVKQKGLSFTSTMVFDRSLYDVRFGSDKFFDNLGDSAIDNEIPVSVTLIAQPQK